MSGDNIYKANETPVHYESTATKLTEGIWEGPKDGSAPGCVIARDHVWQKADSSTMSPKEVDELIKMVRDSSRVDMDCPPLPGFPSTDTTQNKSEDLQKVSAGVQAIESHDDRKIAEFFETATPKQRAELGKRLEELGYKVDHMPPSLAEQMRIGGSTHEHYKITKPGSAFASGIYVSITRNPSMGPMDHPHADVAFDK